MSDIIQRLKLVTDFGQCRKAMLDAVVEIERLEAEIAKAQEQLDRYTRISESGLSVGDDLDNIERLGVLETELAKANATIDLLAEERKLSGADLRQKYSGV